MMTSLQCVRAHSHPSPALAVLVRVKNEMALLPEFWRRIAKQTIYSDLEIIFLDSGSTDGTLKFLATLPVALYTIAPEEFQFGSSCNLIASLSVAQNLVFLSGHVLLEDGDALERIVRVLAEHPFTAAYLRQIANSLTGASAYEQAFLVRRFPAHSEDAVQMTVPAGFSNAASALTRASWEKNRFPAVDASEDYLWAKQHLEDGGKLFYLPGIRVMHSHLESPEAVYRRVRLNVRSRGIVGSRTRAAYYFVGILGSLLLRGAGWSESWRYATSHARAYLP